MNHGAGFIKVADLVNLVVLIAQVGLFHFVDPRIPQYNPQMSRPVLASRDVSKFPQMLVFDWGLFAAWRSISL